MYTAGIKKILIVEWYSDIDKLCELADATGHRAILHNKKVYIKVNMFWEKSPFEIDDFSDGGNQT